jgi:elongation factor G
MIYVNKMDITGANFYNVLEMIHDRLKCNAVPIQLPIGSEADFRGIIDLVTMTADVYYDDLGKDMRSEPIPEELADLAAEYREKLMGTWQDVLFEEAEGDYFTGHAPNYIKVYVPVENLHNEVRTVRLTEIYKDGMKGEIVN